MCVISCVIVWLVWLGVRLLLVMLLVWWLSVCVVSWRDSVC